MGKRHFLELARHGEAEAIATLINRNLHPKGIFAIVKYEFGYLQICLEAEKLVQRGALLRFIRQGLKRLDVEGVRLVRVYGRKKGESCFRWQDCFALTETPPTLGSFEPTTDDLKKLARQGDIEAIALLLNQALRHKQWTVNAAIKDVCLKVNIYGETPPDAASAVTLATRVIARVRSPFFNRVEIRGYGTKPELLQWLDCFDNDDEEMREKATLPQKSTQPHRSKDTNRSKDKDKSSPMMFISKLSTWF